MSSILTNNSAMVALQTMKKINMNMATTQSEISTGKSVATAKDNAAVWAISKVMESDVKGFKGISDSLNLGSSTVAVAREAAETVTDLLTEMKGKIVSAQQSNVDRAKIQTDVAKLREQIGSVVGAAQFNGLNLVNGSTTGATNILSSLDRSSSGVAASSIGINAQNLSIGGYTAKSVFADAATAAAIRAARRPLGRILIEAGMLREVHGVRLLHVAPGPHLRELLCGGDFGEAAVEPLYGRVATIELDGRPAVELLEIVVPHRGRQPVSPAVSSNGNC